MRKTVAILAALLVCLCAAAQGNATLNLFRSATSTELTQFAEHYDFNMDYETFEVIYRRSIVDTLTTRPGTSYMLKGITVAGHFCPVTALIARKGWPGSLAATPINLKGDRSNSTLVADIMAEFDRTLGPETSRGAMGMDVHIWEKDGINYVLHTDDDGLVTINVNALSQDERTSGYQTNRSRLVADLSRTLEDAQHYSSECLGVWYEAVHNNRYGKRYVRDFNTALRRYMKARNRENRFKEFYSRGVILGRNIQSVGTDVPEEMLPDFQAVKAAAEVVSELYGLTVAPAGAYNEYRDKLEGLIAESSYMLEKL